MNGEMNERPTRDRLIKPTSQAPIEKKDKAQPTTKRQLIDIDENNDTLHNVDAFSKAIQRAKNLRNKMEEAIGDDAWEKLHGPHEVPKKYVPPFLRQGQQQDEAKVDSMDKLYELEIDEAHRTQTEAHNTQKNAGGSHPGHSMNIENEEAIRFAGRGGNIKEMRFIRLKIKSMIIEDNQLLQKLTGKSFSLMVALPLADVYKNIIQNQIIKLNDAKEISFNEFEFSQLSLYNFRINEETFHDLSKSFLQVMLDEFGVHGEISLSKLILAENFQLRIQVPLIKTVIVENKQTKKAEAAATKSTKGGRKTAKEIADAKAKKEQPEVQKIQTQAGSILIELNLQKGDTEEELDRNYHLKLQQQREMQKREEELKMFEKKKRAMMLLEEQPTFAQLYLHVERVGKGGIFVDRNGLEITSARRINEKEQEESLSRAEDTESQKDLSVQQPDEQSLNWPKRNLYVSYKAFPTLEKLISTVLWGDSEPNFNHRSQFPVLMTPDIIERLEKFTFVIEVWDQVSPDRNDLVGLVKIPLAGFCYSLKTTEEDIFSLNFLAEKYNMYPMVVTDELMPIYSPKHGKNIGTLKIMLALGTPLQVNKQIQKENELERIRNNSILAQKQTKMQTKLMQNFAENNVNNRASQDLRQQEATFKKVIEEENVKRAEEETKRKEEEIKNNPLAGLFTPGKNNKQFANALRQSLQMSAGKKDYDIRQNSYLSAMRKLFEEIRTSGEIGEINSENLFKNEIRNHDGTVHKDEFVYTLLNTEQLTLTRTEVFHIVDLMINIVQLDSRAAIDIDELQSGYLAYQKYNDLIEKRIVDLLEKFKIAICKKLEFDDDIFELAQAIEERSADSKVLLSDLRSEMEKRGIVIRDAIYDQLACYFDLDHSGTVYIASFCNFLRDPETQNFNFFKLNPSVLSSHVSDYIRNCLASRPEQLSILENEIKKEIMKSRRKQEKNEPEDLVNLDGTFEGQNEVQSEELPLDLLLNEQINAKLFQVKLKRVGIVLSLWEVFSIFDQINTQMAKVFFEPQRYHNTLFEHFYMLITGNDYRKNIEDIQSKIKQEAEAQQKAKEAQAQQNKKKNNQDKHKRRRKRSPKDDDALSLAEDLNLNRVGRDHSSDSNLLDSEPENDVDDRDLTASQLERKRKRQKARDEGRPYQHVKHIFDINIRELKNIPILTRFIREAQDYEKAVVSGNKKFTQESHEDSDSSCLGKAEDQNPNYIQNVSVKYSFPLDEDEVLESDYIRKVIPGRKDKNGEDIPESNNCYDYTVSMNTVHTYLLSKDESIQHLLSGQQKMMTSQQTTQLFNISVALYQENREFIIGNAQLPLEDLVDLIKDYEQEVGSFVAKEEKSILKRILFLYGTSYSQRENCIIGKVAIDISYSAMKKFLSAQEEKAQRKNKKAGNDDAQGSCFMHRETFINRKIPLNALLSVFVDRVTNLKESIENIEHFARINHNTFRPDYEDGDQSITGPEQQVDRKRVLTQILKNGLNLVVLSSIFDEDEDLKLRFADSQQQTRMLYNSLNPVFGESYQMQVQMDTKIFDYLKSKRAVFEVRHYILSNNRKNEGFANSVSSDADQRNDYITLGYVRVPLLHLITKNNGIDGDFIILDDYKQKMGALKLRIALNHHNSQRPLFSGSTRLPNQLPAHAQAPSANTQNVDQLRTATLIDRSVVLNNNNSAKTLDLNRATSTLQGHTYDKSKFFLALNFVELILQDRAELLECISTVNQRSLSNLLFLKFKFLGLNYQTRFVSLDENSYAQKGQNMQSQFMKAINMITFDIAKTVFLPIDMSDQKQVEQAFACPLEVQLWHRITSQRPYRQPDEEKLIGSFFVELNELPKIQNMRIKGGQQDKFYCYESYFTLHDASKERISRDRLALKMFLIKNDNQQTLEELDLFFHSKSRQEIESQITSKLDPLAKGYVELDDLTQLIEEREIDKRVAHKMNCMINDHLEFKNSDSVFYSPLFGLPPPYFKYAKKFDSFGIIERFMKELTSLDSHEQGFVPLALFRSVLEHELRIKMEIVDDFVSACKQPLKSLDVNVMTNSFQSSLDFIVLIRKLVKLIEVQNKSELLALTRAELPSQDTNQRLVLSIDIESAMRVKNPDNEFEPPNVLIRFNLPQLEGVVGDYTFETDVVKESCYPTWHSRDHRVVIPLTESNINNLASGDKQLDFQVFNAKEWLSSSIQGTKPKVSLIGSAYVDISALIIDTAHESNLISGYYHILNRQPVIASVTKQSLGQVKITIRADNNIGECKRISMQEGKLPSLSYSPTKIPAHMKNEFKFNRDDEEVIRESLNISGVENPFRKDTTFGGSFLSKHLKKEDFEEFDLIREQKHIRESQEQENIRTGLSMKDARMAYKFELEIREKSRDELLEAHKKNMEDLDELYKSLQSSLSGSVSDFGIQQKKIMVQSFADNQRAGNVSVKQVVDTLLDSIDKNTEVVTTSVQEISMFSRIPDLTQTQKTDEQRQVIQQQLRPRMDAVFNPFTSKVEEGAGLIDESPHESDNELERD